MRELRAKGDLAIKLPPGSAFAYETAEHLPKLHQACLVVGPRGSGKTTATVNLVERLPFDRIFAISPSMLSNKKLMDRLKIRKEDVFDDPDDPAVLDRVRAEIDKERDVLESHWQAMERYRRMMRAISSKSELWRIPDEDMVAFFDGSDFKPPEHWTGGRPPCMALIIDDAMGSQLYSKPRKINQMTIYHRHLGQLKKGGALGCSLFFLVQSYKAQSGGITRAIRGNTTSMILFSNKNTKSLDEIAEEMAGEVAPATFHSVYAAAIKEPHDFLFVDMHPKRPEHRFRRNLDTYLVPDASP